LTAITPASYRGAICCSRELSFDARKWVRPTGTPQVFWKASSTNKKQGLFGDIPELVDAFLSIGFGDLTARQNAEGAFFAPTVLARGS
jgi:hypothetical protein